jgi:hypothetical protein
MHKYDTQAFNTMFTLKLSYYNLTLCLQKGKKNVLQQIEHVFSGSNSLNVRNIHLALDVNTFSASSTPETVPVWSPTIDGLDLPLIAITGRGKKITCTQ